MIRVAICDDDSNFLRTTHQKVEQEFMKLNEETSVYSTESIDELLELLREGTINYGKHFDMVMLDLEMPQMHGHQVAARIHALDPKILIFFITSHTEEVLDSFHYGASGFIPKTKLDKRLTCEIQNAIISIKKMQQAELVTVNVLKGEKSCGRRQVATTRLNVRDITHIESLARQILIHSGSEKIALHADSFASVLSQFENYGFIKIYRSVAVNPAKIKRIDGQSVLLTSGEKVPYRKSVRELLLDSISKYPSGAD